MLADALGSSTRWLAQSLGQAPDIGNCTRTLLHLRDERLRTLLTERLSALHPAKIAAMAESFALGVAATAYIVCSRPAHAFACHMRHLVQARGEGRSRRRGRESRSWYWNLQAISFEASRTSHKDWLTGGALPRMAGGTIYSVHAGRLHLENIDFEQLRWTLFSATHIERGARLSAAMHQKLASIALKRRK